MDKLFHIQLSRTFAAITLSLGLILGAGASIANAAGGAPKPEKQEWSFNGIFGTYDRGALRRGFQVYSEVCAGCHALGLIAYRNLGDIGFSEDEIKEIAVEFEVEDGPDDEGEMYMRPALPADHMVPPFANDNAARSSNNGALPPDLSLMVKARFGGADYLYALMTGYKEDAPDGFELSEDMNYNTYFPGHQIAMAPPLEDEMVEYADGTPATLQQHARDISTFLAWTASPEMEERKSLGIKTILFLIVLTAMMYALKRQIWAKLH
jgi:ubiquinol-cytochrome c reductase cytochrome c1 subunit